MKNKILAFILMISILTCSVSCLVVYASSDHVEQSIVKVSNGVLDGYSKLLRYAGIIIDSGIEVNRYTLQFVKERLIALGLLSNNASDEDVEDFFNQNIIQSGNNITYTENLNTYVKSEINQIISSYGFYYVYSFDILQNTSSFPSGDKYNAVKTMCQTYQDEYYIFMHLNSDSLVLCPIDSYGLVQGTVTNNYVYGFNYNYTSWNLYNYSSNKWTYNNTTKTFEKSGTWGYDNKSTFYKIDNPTVNISNGVFTITYNGCHEYKMFRTLNDFKSSSIGANPYYITDSYNNYKNITGSYNTVTTDNSVTYGDITNYIDSYVGENGKEPTQNEINVYITVTNDNGGGSGNNSGGGNGSGTGGDGSSIWDFLSNLGEVLGGLIRNLGNMLTSLIDSIISIVNDVIGKIPDVFSSLLGTVFGGLPEDIRAIIILGVTVMVVYGIIKVIRG